MTESAAARQTPKPLSVDEIIGRLNADGIDDLHKFVQSEMEWRRKAAAAFKKADYTFANFGNVDTSRPAKHGVPTVPVKIDGVLYDPKDINRFNGTPLHFVAPTKESPLQAFTGDQWPSIIKEQVRTEMMASHGDIQFLDCPAGSRYPCYVVPSVPGGGVTIHPPAEFFTDVNFGGDHIWLNKGRQWSDLTKVGRGDFWDRHDWNDCISSVNPDQEGLPGWLVMCEDIHLGGRSFTILITNSPGDGLPIPSLVPFGWNDICSSIVYW